MRGWAPATLLALLALPGTAFAESKASIDPSVASMPASAAQTGTSPSSDNTPESLPAVPNDQPNGVAAPDEKPQATTGVPSAEAWHVINWVIASRDNNELPFIVLDKVAAELFLFDPAGQLVGAAPALVGMTVGDDATPGVGDRELSNIPPRDRKTPAGRFVAKFGRAAGGRNVLWVDYPSAISIHAVVHIRNQHRLERINSPTSEDNRVTYGCINVPAKFYADVIKPAFTGKPGIVYVLPETKPIGEVFIAMPPQSPAG